MHWSQMTVRLLWQGPVGSMLMSHVTFEVVLEKPEGVALLFVPLTGARDS